MGRKAKGKSTAAPAELDPEVASVVETKQKAGDDALEAKKFGDALAAYDEALKALPERHGLIAGLHASKASVYLSDRKYKEAIKECNQGLAVEGNNEKVLKCRAHARYESGMFKDALNDIQKATSSGEKSEQDTEFEQKVRSALSGKTSQNGTAEGANGAVAEGGNGGGGANGAVSKKKETYTREQTASMLKQAPSMFVCKATLEQETKYVHVPFGVGYHQLQQIIKSRWTGLHNFKIFYHDRDADWVLITNSKDVQKAQQEILQYAQRMVNQRQRQGLDSQPPTCRFKLEKCHKADVPPVPKEERPRGEETSKVVVKSADPHAEETVIELDDWLIEFANLFREHLGIDPDKHVDMQTEGTERCTRALDTVVALPEARGLFGEAFDRFRDVTCVGLCNWANVHLCLAKKLLEAAAGDGGGGYAAVKAEFEEHCGESIRRYNEALGFNEACVEALLGIGQVHTEEARAAAGILIPPLDGVDSEAYKALNPEEMEDITRQQGKDANTKLKAALEHVTADAVKASAPVWDKVYAVFERARAAAEATSKRDETAAREEARAPLTVSQPAEDEMHLLGNQVQIMWGNALYDQSQIWAGVGLDGWKAMLDDAKARFLGATCKESDVTEALRNHLQAEDLDLPPEDTATDDIAKAGSSGAAAAEDGSGEGKKEAPAQKQGAKGLPALKKKKKGDK